jgi:fibronectin-binding autotransporter adhesin
MKRFLPFFIAVSLLSFALPVSAGTPLERALRRLKKHRHSFAANDPAWLGPGGTATAPTTGNWNLAGNWSPSGVPASSTATLLDFGGSGASAYTSSNDIAANFTFGTMTLNSTASVTEIINGSSFEVGTGTATQISQTNSGAFNIQNAITSNDAATLTLSGNGTGVATLSGVISEKNTGSKFVDVVKTGTSTFVLSGANTYSHGTTVSGGGNLFVNNTTGSGTGSGAVGVSGSGTALGGSGTISGTVSIASGSHLEPGASGIGSTGILKTGNVTLSSGSFFNVDLNNTTVGTGYDQLSVTGTVNVTGSNLVVNAGALTPGQKFFIVSNDSNDAVTGTFAGLIQNATFTAGPNTFQINYADLFSGSANDISLTVIPEPSTWVLVGIGLGMMGLFKRRRFIRIG